MSKTWKLCVGLVFGSLLSVQAMAEIEMERRAVPEQGLSIEVPKEFTVMSDEIKAVKYPTQNAPKVVYTDATSKVNIAWTIGEFPLPAEQLTQYKDMIVQSIANYSPEAEEVKIADGKQAYIISFTIQAPDAEIYNAMLLTSNEGQSAMFTFNSTVDMLDTYKEAGRAALLSIKFEK